MTELTLKDKHPDAPYTIEQLCRTERLPAGTHWEAGMITTTDGAHDRKHLVVSVTDMGLQPPPHGGPPMQCYAVVLIHLGHFYADNRFKLAPRRTEKQQELWVSAGEPPTGRIRNFILARPIGDTKPIKVKAHKTFTMKPKGPITVTLDKPLPKQTPEAVLDSFRIK